MKVSASSCCLTAAVLFASLAIAPVRAEDSAPAADSASVAKKEAVPSKEVDVATLAREADRKYVPPASTGNTVTVVTGKVGVYKTFLPIPQYYVLKYTDAPDIALDLSERIPAVSSYTYDRERDPESKTLTRRYKIETMYLGGPEGYAPILAANTAQAGADVEQGKTVSVVALLVGVATRSMNVANTIASNSGVKYGLGHKWMTADLLASLAPGLKKVIVTRYSGDLGFQEALTAAYEDVSDDELRKINYEEGLKRLVGIKPL